MLKYHNVVMLYCCNTGKFENHILQNLKTIGHNFQLWEKNERSAGNFDFAVKIDLLYIYQIQIEYIERKLLSDHER